jgi:hypothetical protein
MWPFFQENSLCIALSRINTLVVQPGWVSRQSIFVWANTT